MADLEAIARALIAPKGDETQPDIRITSFTIIQYAGEKCLWISSQHHGDRDLLHNLRQAGLTTANRDAKGAPGQTLLYADEVNSEHKNSNFAVEIKFIDRSGPG